MSAVPAVLVRRSEAVATVLLNRPDRRNALNDGLVDALVEALQDLVSASWCRAIVLTGAGSAFCAGGDLADNCPEGVGPLEAVDRQRRFLRAAELLLRCPKPTVAAVNGPAIGAGCSLALLCDEVLLAPPAKLGLGFLGVGLPPDFLAASTLQRRVGWTVATDLLHSGRLVGAKEAVEMRLAHAVVTSDIQAAATSRAAELARLSPLAFAMTKRMLQAAHPIPELSLEHEAMAVGLAVVSPEFREATARFRPT